MIPFVLTPDVTPEDLRDMMIESFRYCLGRASYAAPTCIERLKRYRINLTDFDRALIHKEIIQAIAHGPIPYEREWAEAAEVVR